MDVAVSVQPNMPTIEGHRSLSLSEFAENYQNVLNENRQLAGRLNEAMQEIAQLRAQLNNRLESVIAAKERLMRDEFERKLQENGTKVKSMKVELEQKITSLQVELKQERVLIEKFKKAQSSCMCRYRDVLPANWIKR